MTNDVERPLPRGDVTDGVVRVGDTVRRPRQATSELVGEYLEHLHRRGFERAPRFLGVDAQGRDMLTFLAGDVPGDDIPEWAAGDDALPPVASLLRTLHDASQGFEPSAVPQEPGRPTPLLPDDEPRLFAHRDVTPGNTVYRDGVAWGVIDFDLCGWTTRAVDVANTAMHWVPLCDPVDRRPVHADVDVAWRLRLLLDEYGRDLVPAENLLRAAQLRFEGAYASMHWAAVHRGGGWARMWRDGAGEKIQRRVAWFASVRDELRAGLG